MSTPDFDTAVASRSTSTSPFGKVETEAKTHVDDYTLVLFDKMARECGSVRGPFLRDLMYLAVHGKTFNEVAADHQRDLMAQQGLNQALIRGFGK